MATIETSHRLRPSLEAFSAEDFETASIRSAAPSYISDAPSYHTTIHHDEPIPPYSPRGAAQNTTPATSTSGPVSLSATGPVAAAAAAHRTASVPTLLPSSTIVSPGLPPIPPAPPRRRSDVPTLGEFRIPSWSTISSNPTYHRVANRRVQAASQLADIKRMVLERVEEEEKERNRVRPLEDPWLVGEEAAARARREREARERVGDAVLVREDRRWDWWLAQSDRDASRGKLARRVGAAFR